jgi:hypothetical protein
MRLAGNELGRDGEILHRSSYRGGRNVTGELFEDILGASVGFGCNESCMCSVGSYDYETVPFRRKIRKTIYRKLVWTNVVNGVTGRGECLRHIAGEQRVRIAHRQPID